MAQLIVPTVNMGFRLATEGDSIQPDVEIRVEDRQDGHFDDAFRSVVDNLLPAYQCASLGSRLSQRTQRIHADELRIFGRDWNRRIDIFLWS